MVTSPVAQREVNDLDIEVHNVFGFDELLQGTNGFSRDRLIWEGELEDGR